MGKWSLSYRLSKICQDSVGAVFGSLNVRSILEKVPEVDEKCVFSPVLRRTVLGDAATMFSMICPRPNVLFEPHNLP